MNTGLTKDAATSGKEHTEDNSKIVITKLDDKPNDASVEKSKVSAEKDPDEKVVEEVTTVNTEFENYNSVEVNPEKDVTVKTTHLQYKCEECSYENISEQGLKQQKKMKHKIPQTDGANDNDLKEDEVPDIFTPGSS